MTTLQVQVQLFWKDCVQQEVTSDCACGSGWALPATANTLSACYLTHYASMFILCDSLFTAHVRASRQMCVSGCPHLPTLRPRTP